jgi:NAD(P)H-dependent flavin oxidoreductase YrpB (nitropropane dioxygenase family)
LIATGEIKTPPKKATPTAKKVLEPDGAIIGCVRDFFGDVTFGTTTEMEWSGKILAYAPPDEAVMDWIPKAMGKLRSNTVDEAILMLPMQPPKTHTNVVQNLLREFACCFMGGRPVVLFYIGTRPCDFRAAFDSIGVSVVPACSVRYDAVALELV